jgi:hypothetical protein
MKEQAENGSPAQIGEFLGAWPVREKRLVVVVREDALDLDMRTRIRVERNFRYAHARRHIS